MIALHYIDGLIPVVVQDAVTREVLMVAYANAEAVEKTRETGFAHYFSRSRKQLWKKGEESGHIQRIREIRVDCDEDCILYLVEQEGAACHTGYRSCFFRTIEGKTISEKVFDPSKVYANKGQ
jgi:phosphoribosyl-AMP cyclohydrolase